MALIKCPECGGSVSSQAAKCPHCGCTFTVCPECGNVKLGTHNTCDACGYELEKTTTPTPETKSEYDSADIIELWKSRVPSEKWIISLFKWLPRIMLVISTACLVGAVIVVLRFAALNELEKLVKLKNTLSTLSLLLTFEGIASVLYGITFFKSAYVRLRCAAWLRKSNFDIIAYCKRKGITTERMQELNGETYFECVNSIYLHYNKKATTRSCTSVAIYALIYIVITIIVTVFLYNLLKAPVSSVMVLQSISLKQLFPWGKLIIAIVVEVGIVVAQVITDYLMTTKKAIAWLDAELASQDHTSEAAE